MLQAKTDNQVELKAAKKCVHTHLSRDLSRVYFQSIRYFRFMAGERWGRCLEGLSSCIPEVAFPDI